MANAKIVFGVSLSIAFGTVAYVHYAQQLERLRLQAGIERDLERQRLKQAIKTEKNKSDCN